jgi:hypothetical protein
LGFGLFKKGLGFGEKSGFSEKSSVWISTAAVEALKKIIGLPELLAQAHA